MVTQLGAPEAAHAQPAGPVIAMVPLPPEEGNASPPALSENEQEDVGWFTVAGRPAIVRVALRAAPGLGATTKSTLPGPLPAAEPEIVIQLGRPDTPQAQPAAV